jgi:hypothetical protein
MAFKLLYTNLAGPQGDFLVNSAAVFEAGMVGLVQGNSNGDPEVIVALSGSTGLVGIIDDNKTTQFYAAVVAEVVVSGQTTLAHANLISSSFSGTAGIALASATNGTVTNSLSPGATATANYSYVIPGKAGDDTTLGSGKCTLWLQEGEYATDIYEVSAVTGPANYTVGTKLYVADSSYGQTGRLTNRNGGGSLVAYVTKTPTAGNPYMHFFKTGI